MRLLALILAALAVFWTESGYGESWRNLASPESPHLMEVETGQTLFGEPHPESLLLLGEGWREPAIKRLAVLDEYLWATSLVSTASLTIVNPRPLILEIHMHPMLVPDLGPQEVEIVLNGHRLGACEFDLAEGWSAKRFRFAVPVNVQRQGQNELFFNSRYAVSGVQMGTAPDGRVFSFGLRGFGLFEPEAEGPVPSLKPLLEGERILMPPNTRLHFPFRVPSQGGLRFTVDAPQGPGAEAAQILLRRETIEGVVEESIYPGTGAGDALDVAIIGAPEEVVSLVFSSSGALGELYWPSPQLHGPGLTVKKGPLEEARAPEARNVILIICDAMVKTGLHSYGYHRPTSPAMDRLAAEGVQFMNPMSAASYTYSSTWSLLTSLYPSQHKAPDAPLQVVPEAPRLQQVLSNAGIRTGVVSAQHWIGPTYGTTDGFDEYHRAIESAEVLLTAADPGLLTDLALDFLERHKDERFFLYLHHRPPHEPYYPPEAFANTFTLDPAGIMDPTAAVMGGVKDETLTLPRESMLHMRARYDENLLGVDAEIERVIQKLHELELDEDTLVIITSDHGEAFMEHGFLSHGRTLYDEVVSVPLIFWGADIEQIFPKQPTMPTTTVHLYPSICEALGVPVPEGIAGKSLFQVHEYTSDDVLSFAKGCWLLQTHLWDPLEAFWWERYKLIRDTVSNRVEVYDLHRDPREKSDLSRLRPVLRDYLLAHGEAWLREQSVYERGDAIMLDIENDQESVELLETLGYL